MTVFCLVFYDLYVAAISAILLLRSGRGWGGGGGDGVWCSSGEAIHIRISQTDHHYYIFLKNKFREFY